MPLPSLRALAARAGLRLRDLAAPPIQNAWRAAPFVTIDGPRAPLHAPRDYAAFAREGFMQNPIAYRSVRMIAEAVGCIPFLLYDGPNEVEQHPLLDLVRRPSSNTTTADLLEQLVGFLLVSGNAYLETTAVDGQLRALYALRPDRMTIVPGPDGWPDGHAYTLDGRTTRITGEATAGVPRILHLKLFHPLDDHYGLSPIEAASQAIDLHNTASKWNKALLDNSARPSGALVYTARDGNLTNDQFDRLKRELESGFQGAGNAGRPLLLEGGLDWKAMSLSPKDLDFIEARNAAAREIALALGVPPMLLAIPGDNTYSNYQEATRAFYRQTVLPLANRIATALSSWLAGPQGLTLRPDLDQVDALTPERSELWTRLDAATFLTPNEKRAAAGYDPIAEGGDELKRAHPNVPIGALKGGYNPDQPRIPAGNGRGSGEWAGGGGSEGDTFEVSPDPNLQEVARQRWRQFRGSPAQETRAEIANNRARIAIDRVRTLDPKWRGPTSAYNDIEGEIRHLESVAQAAEARYLQITRDAIPGVNPAWGVNRLRQELNERGYYFEHTTRAPGWRYVNPTTLEEVRIMQRPSRAYREDPVEKHTFEYYYRYRRRQGQGEGAHTPIPDKD